MRKYVHMKITGNALFDWFVTWYNRKLLRGVVKKVAWNEHLITGREVHIADVFGSYTVFDSRERQDLNKAGRFGKVTVLELMRMSIWNSTEHEQRIRKKNVNKKSKKAYKFTG